MFVLMLKIPVKASCVTHLTDARYFAAFGVSFLGFEVESNRDNQISLDEFIEIKNWVEGPKIIGEISDPERTDVSDLEDYMVEGWHIGAYCSQDIQGLSGTIIRDVLIDQIDVVKDLPAADIWIFKGQSPYSEICRTLDQLGIEKNQGLIDTPNLEGLEDQSSYGFVVRGSTEEKVGFKSYEDLEDLFDKIID